MKKDKIYCFIDRIKFIFKLIKDLKLSLLIVCLFLCVINVILPYITMINTQEIINRIQIGLSIRLILKRLIIFLILGILYIISSNLYNFLILKYKEYLYLELNKKFLDNSLKFNLKDFENPEVYNIIQRAEQEIGIRPYNIIISLLSIISQSVNLISAFLILTKWHLTLIIGFILLASFASKYFISISKNEYDILMNRTNYERKSWYISHLLIKDEYIKEVRLFGLSKYLIQQFIELRSRFFKENVDVLKRQYIFSEIYQLMNYVISFFIIFLAIYESTQGIILVGTAMTYINTSSKIENAIQNIVSNIFGIYKDSLYIDNIKKYFNYESNKFYGNKTLKNITTIEFVNVSFKYPNREVYAIRNTSFKIKKGEILAIVGENGSGKTTIIKLLNGLYDEYEGNILINGIEIREIDKKSLRNCLATLFQDYNKYQFTIKENIGFGSIDNLDDIEKIKYSAKKGGADQFINCLPNNYTQQVGYWFEGGTQLSGGQWQKLGLSRLFMKNADCLILDEPTASLDPFSELEIFKQLYQNSNEKINIIITHRFINTVFANKIIVLKNGEIIEKGKHDELLKQDGFYKDMFDIQSRGITLN
ncbi:ABC transporter ATP-binding protein/permease [Faecalibacillus intestinalis]|uniref:ABC transporter ATP-binding protein/permease n=2 Tax=Faecalibacillus intestinalis TaxID=1982626 RepID=A0A2T3FVS4_9FIRM|nr:ABC transporter ATP-binding protein [Faecalibacillus intestinalis]RGF27014.1 ABC transporter ATP-binding protein [Coprobacillus sp. AM09-26]RHH11305.1 ABC transporter ATP-binding protein [Coprobacillus sp. AM18-4LB-d2]RHQ18048.1 ABC transporter ATP-binding protein [Coprobacillus sp. AF29-3BH]MCB8593115.1 ABC transporter ATP-binding protein/permease [Faecalibacillus intestinalis]MCB8614378.1 ABC transporter ATP-binding protein/permease [Faecalibacillus intestinalis]